jgi:signal transduction histidine kinase
MMTGLQSHFFTMKTQFGNDYQADIDMVANFLRIIFEADTCVYIKISGNEKMLVSIVNTGIGTIKPQDLTPIIFEEIDKLPVLRQNSPAEKTVTPLNSVIRQISADLFLTIHLLFTDEKLTGALCITTKTSLHSDEDFFWLTILQAEINNLERFHSLRTDNEILKNQLLEKDQFYSVIAHDLKSPFNGFLGLTFLLSEESESIPSPEIQEIILTLRNSANNMFWLLESFLEWSRILRGVLPCNPQPVMLKALLQKVTQNLYEIIDQKQILINDQIPDNLAVVGDPLYIFSAIRHLVMNGIKFSTAGGVIEMYAKEQDDNHSIVIVKDHGTGISPEIQAGLFDTRKLVKKQGTHGESGAGLGLIISKWYIEQSGGKLWYETSLELGTTMYFTLPSPVTLN